MQPRLPGFILSTGPTSATSQTELSHIEAQPSHIFYSLVGQRGWQMEEFDAAQRPQAVEGSGHREQLEHRPSQNLNIGRQVGPEGEHLRSTTTAAPQDGSPLHPGGSGGGEGEDDSASATRHSTTHTAARGFSDLPLEIREMIWEQAWCRRVVKPLIGSCAGPHAFEDSCAICINKVRPAPTREPSVAFVNREAWRRARKTALPLTVWPEDRVPPEVTNGRVFWFNHHTDVIWLCWLSI